MKPNMGSHKRFIDFAASAGSPLSPGKYRATIWEDDAMPNEVVRVERFVIAGDVLELYLASAGGAAVILEPVQ